jgi:hypothetical protein
MNFKILETQVLPDNTKRMIIFVEPEELFYLGYFLETLEGYCNYTTIKKKHLQVDAAPDFYEEFLNIISTMQKWKIQ